MTFTDGILRTPGSNLAHGLTTAGCSVPDHSLALAQHAKYAEALERAGLQVTVLEPLPAFPDAYFVEDVAVVAAEVAVITRPGAAARRGEEAFIEPVLAQHRTIARILNPATLDGGDVLIAGRRVLVGLTDRTNPEGARQLQEILSPHGYGRHPRHPLMRRYILKKAVMRLAAAPTHCGLDQSHPAQGIG